MVVSLYLGVEKKPCFKWLQNVGALQKEQTFSAENPGEAGNLHQAEARFAGCEIEKQVQTHARKTGGVASWTLKRPLCVAFHPEKSGTKPEKKRSIGDRGCLSCWRGLSQASVLVPV